MSIAERLAASVIISLILAACSPSDGDRQVRVATTTSVQNSGLIDHLRPAFRRSSGAEMQIFSVGSGRALQLLESGEADVAISHAPQIEERFLSRHSDWSYRKIAHNRFVIVGPAADQGRIAAAADAVDAFRRIADSGSAFVSRGDQSGTHEREEMLWQLAGRRPAAGRMIVSGRGMAQALRHAEEAEAYTLSDEPTFWQLRDELQLTSLFADDSRLRNTYAVIAPAGNRHAAAFAAWLLSPEGIKSMTGFEIDGQHPYHPWPPNCPAHNPVDLPCDVGGSASRAQ